jgi:transketolase
MLLYSVAYLAGYPVRLDEIKNFRQFGSRVAGHPEREIELGVETTTGPLGQGLANAVGMALAEKHLAAEFNRPDLDVVEHFTYVFMGDGCMMEGISHEASSFAGTHKLGRLIAFYDDNGISIDGNTRGWFTDDTPKRFDAYGWHVVPNVDGHDAAAVAKAIEAARADQERPSLICCKTIIGYGAPNVQGTSATHGAALGPVEVAAARRAGLGQAPFVFRPRKTAGMRASAARGSKPSGRSASRPTAGCTRSWRTNSRAGCAASCRRAGPSTRSWRSRRSPLQRRPWPRARRRRVRSRRSRRRCRS